MRADRRGDSATITFGEVQFRAMDSTATAIASVVSSGTVALATLIVNALTKRGDRKHESRLDYERRIWEDKRTALVAVIGDCQAIRSACSSDPPGFIGQDTPLEARKRYGILRTFDTVQGDLLKREGALVAYADRSVWVPFEKLTRTVNSEIEEHFEALSVMEPYLREKKEAAIDANDFTAAAEFREDEKRTRHSTAMSCTLDIDTLRDLCAMIIDSARADLGDQPRPLAASPPAKHY
jgi:hypothetical protein